MNGSKVRGEISSPPISGRRFLKAAWLIQDEFLSIAHIQFSASFAALLPS
jgi:hypothetical protein